MDDNSLYRIRYEILRIKYKKQQNEIEQLKIKVEKAETLKVEYAKLEDEIEQLRHTEIEAEILEEENMMLKRDIERLENEAHSRCVELEDKCDSLQSELSTFTKYESVKKVKQIEEHLDSLNQNLNLIIEKLTTYSKELNQEQSSNAIEKSMTQYQERKTELSETGFAFVSEPNFPAMIEYYNKIFRINETRIQDELTPLYEANKRIRHKANEFRLKIDDRVKNVAQFAEEENNKLKKISEEPLQNFVSLPKKILTYILERIASRIFVFDSIKAAIIGADLETKIVRKNCLSENLDDSGRNSIIMYKIPEGRDGEDDVAKIKSFLNQADLETNLEIKVERLEEPEKPLKVTFSDARIIEQLLQLSNEKTLFRGSYIRMKRCSE